MGMSSLGQANLAPCSQQDLPKQAWHPLCAWARITPGASEVFPCFPSMAAPHTDPMLTLLSLGLG